MAENQETAELILPGGKSVKLPVIVGTENERALDVSKLRAQTGYITLDESYANTGSCHSAITFIDGEKGILRYRGYPIEELAEHSSFLETSYLLLYGRLPSQQELTEFTNKVSRNMVIHEDMKRFYDGFPREAHPMAILSSVVAAAYTFHQAWEDPRDKEAQEKGVIRLMGTLPTMAAFSYKKSIGEPFIYPDASLSYAANFLNMMFRSPAEEYLIDPDVVRALDVLLILHADHEQNCSTSTVRMVGSSLSNLYASISAGISALWGALHGGANQEVIEMLLHIAGGGGDVKKYVEMAKNKAAGFRLMGFGHRVYQNYDPRAKILKEMCHKVLSKIPEKEPLLEIAMQLEDIALKDSYFIERKLYPNVDFYSGIIYRALNIPTQSFTAMFALGRLPGWMSHWLEMHTNPNFRISRPRQVYTGSTVRHYVPLDQR